MYFGRNAYDPAAISEAQTRLQSFQGAQSISSNQYFGREEDEDAGGMGGSQEGLLGDGTLAGLETAARDAVSRVLANPDVQNVGESIRAGALKVRFPTCGIGIDLTFFVALRLFGPDVGALIFPRLPIFMYIQIFQVE